MAFLLSAIISVCLFSVCISAETEKLPVPQNIKCTSTVHSIKITWDYIDGADAYRIYLLNNHTNKYEKYKSVTGTVCTIKDLESDSKYKIKIAALVKSDKKYTEQTLSKTITVKTKNIDDINEKIDKYNNYIDECEENIDICNYKISLCDDGLYTTNEKIREYKAELEKAKKNKGELVFMNGGYTYLPDSSTINYYNGLISEWQSLNNDFKTAKKQWEKQKSSYVKKQKEYEKQLKKYKNLLK